MNVFPEIVVVSTPPGGHDSTFKWYRQVYEWCAANQIKATFKNQWETSGQFFSSFEILDEQQRMWFKLRWS